MLKLIATLFLLQLAGSVFSQSTFQKVYQHRVPGLLLDEQIYKIIVDANNEFVFAGRTKDVIQQNSAACLYKVTNEGNLNWMKLYAYSIFTNSIKSLIQLPNTNYLLIGYTTDSVYTNTSFIMSTDTSGNVLWSKIFPFSSNTLYLEELGMSGGNVLVGGTINNFSLGSLKDILS